MRWSDAGRAVLVMSLALSACESGASSKTATALPVLVPITDLNDAADIVEVSLVAGVTEKAYLPAGAAEVWAYRDGGKKAARGSVPGPLIEVNQGDRVIVRFRNELPEGTTIHWHGIRVANASDGSTATQDEVAPGDEYTYEFVARDEGTFWYHPHVRGASQVERGLQGMIVVHGGPSIVVDQERTLVLDDVKLKASGALSESTTSLDIMLGRLGNFILANGAIDGELTASGNTRERWRIVNTANGRYFNLQLLGHSFRVIGWDGGLLAEPYFADTLLMAPGERYDVLVELSGETGSQIALETIYYDRGHDVPDVGPERVLTLNLKGQSSSKLKPLPDAWGTSAAVKLVPLEGAVEREFVLDEHEVDDGQDVVFTINDGAFPDVPPVVAREGDTEVWRFDNQSAMDHPFHLHGMFFRVLDVDGVEPEHVGWKDTVNIPQKSKLRFAVEYGEPGTWMYHCHILEHQERGMMGELRISARNAGSSESESAPSACQPACAGDSLCCVDTHGHLPRCVAGSKCPAGLMSEAR